MNSNLPPFNPAWSKTVWDQSLNERLKALEFDLLVTEPMSTHENLALDETLLHRVADSRRRPVFWLWDWSEKAVILGSYQSVSNEIDGTVARSHGYTFSRRISGGGAMVVEPGKSITYSLILPESVVEGLSFRQSFAFLDRWCVQALRGIGVPAGYRPVNDIISPEGKIAGAAQCRRRKTVLHHTTIAYDLDDAFMRALLRHGEERTGRGISSAEKRVSPLSQFTDLSIRAIRGNLLDAFRALFPTRDWHITPDENDEMGHRLRTKFSTREWLYRVE